MKEKLIYFDNAATTFPKPPEVAKAIKTCIERYGGNPGRGAHPLAARASDVIYACRERVGEMFGCAPEGVAFTYGATYALNLAVKGLLRAGDHVLISGLSHNAVLRPVHAMAERGEITYDIYPHHPFDSDEDVLRAVERGLRGNTAMVIATHMSNICSETEPIAEIGALCRRRGIFFVVDGAQSGGHLPIDADGMNITALCLPGHKGLYGVQGVGVLALGKDFPTEDYTTVLEGGSGVNSLEEGMPRLLPELLEAGTPGTPAVAGLLAGLDYVKRTGREEIHAHASMLSSALWDELTSDSFYTVYGSGDGGVVGFNVEGYSPSEVGEILAGEGICVRTGYHCAPLAHRSVGSYLRGSVRVSFGEGNTAKELEKLLSVLRRLKKRGR